ncbi:MAG: hypothetical protein DBY25_00740 [Clostridiales bacterium]|nr:MAG: hypothetical protein DBY25_00740 [Clostridiales bacterium]
MQSRVGCGIITSAVPKIKDFDRDLATPLLQGHAHGFVIRTSRRTLKQSSGRLSKPCITCEKREPFFAYGAQKLVCFLGILAPGLLRVLSCWF